MANGRRGSFPGYSSRAFREMARQKVTHCVTSPPSIAALRKVSVVAMKAVVDCGLRLQ